MWLSSLPLQLQIIILNKCNLSNLTCEICFNCMMLDGSGAAGDNLIVINSTIKIIHLCIASH